MKMNERIREEILQIRNEERKFLTFKEMQTEFEKRPKTKFLWSGIKEKSFGLVFGPSKSGKTIFCENLAMNIAIGRKSFFGHKLSGKPEKALFIGLEEHWENRAERNLKQYSSLTEDEQKLLNSNFLYQQIEFSQFIQKKKDWKNLAMLVADSEASIVFIDSITRMNHGALEDSKTAEEIMQRLRSICYESGVTLVCIHHTPKMYDKPIVMDSIKGSSVFAQESDFALGVNRSTKGHRYLKDIFFRYADDNIEKVKEFEIDENVWLQELGDDYEEKILVKSDRRRNDDKRQEIISFFNDNKDVTHKTNDLINYFTEKLGLKKRQVQYYLKDLVNANEIHSIKIGVYCSLYYNKNEDEDERK